MIVMTMAMMTGMVCGSQYRFVIRECDGRYRAIAHGWRGRPWPRAVDAARELAKKLSIAVTALRKVSCFKFQSPPLLLPTMPNPEEPCSYCSYAAGIVGRPIALRCPCRARYCESLCQLRHWHVHRDTCQWRVLQNILQQHVPRPIARLVLDFVGNIRR